MLGKHCQSCSLWRIVSAGAPGTGLLNYLPDEFFLMKEKQRVKKLQNSLYVTRESAYLHKERETLLVEQTVEGQRKKLLQMPIHSTGNIFYFGNVMVSSQLMDFCDENGMQLAFYDAFGCF